MAGHVPRAMAFDTNAVGVEAADTSMVAWMPADRQKAFNTEEERRTSRATEEATMRCARGRTVSPHRPPEGRRHRLTAQAFVITHSLYHAIVSVIAGPCLPQSNVPPQFNGYWRSVGKK